MYTGRFTELSVEATKKLYSSGDKYAVNGLMDRCARYLSDNMTPENVWEILALADRHNDENLKESATRFIIKENVYLLDDQWMPFCGSHPALAVAVFNQQAKFKNSQESGQAVCFWE